jgi:2,5-dihydroxypyridine 5,6-dioxygenase
MKQAIEHVLSRCAGLQPGEQLAIVTDPAADRSIAVAFRDAARAHGAEVVIVEIEPVRIPGGEPPVAAAAVMLHSDVIIELTSKFIGSSRARIAACEAGARYLTMPAIVAGTLRAGGPLCVDFDALRPVAEAVAARWNAADTFHLTSPAGTDLRGSVRGRRGRVLHGIARERGAYMAPPDIEAGTAPVEGSTDGVAVIDVSLLFMSPGLLREPVRITFRDGEAIAIEGPEAHYLTEMIDRCDDGRMSNLAEVALGLNPWSAPNGVPMEDEAALGGAHIALGNSIAYGGTVAAMAHLDLVMRDVTLRLDGDVIVERGELRIAEMPAAVRR